MFPLRVPGKADPRVVEAIVADVRKYVKRERRKKLPEGVDFWDFDCKTGADQFSAQVTHIKAVIPAIEAASKDETATAIYIEILAKPGIRFKPPVPEVPATDVAEPDAAATEPSPADL
jgi:hypothetical protein